MKISIRKVSAVFVSALILMLGIAAILAAPVSAAQKVGLSKTSITLEVGETATLKLNGASGGKIRWSMSDKEIAKYSKGGKVTAVSEGTAYIYAKYNGKKYKCSVTVVSADDSEIDEVIRLINEERAAAGQPDLVKNDELCKNAQLRAEEISGKFSHTRPDGTECFTAITIPYGYAGENIAMGQKNAEEVMECWMNSTGHKKNILSENFTDVGVGYDSSSNCWVQIFISE